MQLKTKELILRRGWERKAIYINKQRIYFDHDYLPAILNNRKEYSEEKRVLRENKIGLQTPYPANLHVFYEDGTKLYQNAYEATKDMNAQGFTVKMMHPPRDLTEVLDEELWCTAGRGISKPDRDLTRQATIRAKLQTFKRQTPQ